MIDTFLISPIAFLGIRWYAICILAGIIFAVIAGLREGRKLGIYSDFIYYGVIMCVPLSIVGARLWYVLFNLSEFDSFAQVLGLDGGGLSGLAIQGGVIAAIIFVIIYAKKKNMSLYKVFDILAPGFLIGQILGRWGNFFNQELYGPVIENVSLFKALLPSFITKNMYISGAYRHPVFLYESLLNLAGLCLILVLRRKSKKVESGDMLGVYLIWYGIVRIFTESLRADSGADEVLMLGSVKVSILFSVIFIVGGIAFLIAKRFIGKRVKYHTLVEFIEENRMTTILFDLDGTLLDTKNLISRSFIYTFDHYFPEHVLTDEELDSFFGPTLHESFSKYSDDEEKIKEMIAYYREFNIKFHDDLAVPYPHVKEVINILHKKGYKTGIITSKRNDQAMLGLKLAKIDLNIDVLIGANDVSNPKPDPEGINLAIEKLGNPALNKVLFIGDNPADIMAGKNANVFTCAVAYSHRLDEVEALEPDYIIKDLNGLLRILNE